jgi:hypothetical protein
MRSDTDRAKVDALIAALARRVRTPHTLYLVGGTSAVVEGFRASTHDVDVRAEPDSDELLRALSALKEELDINIETASPLDFLPALDGWRDRSPHVTHAGSIEVRHMDFRLQALAKLERGSEQDLADVGHMLHRGLVDRTGLAAAFADMRPGLFRFPAVDEPAFARRVAEHTQQP